MTIDTLYLVHHSHTDIGYTHDQPVIWELQTRFIDEALDLAERYAGDDSDAAFRWTVETTSVLQRWLARASDREVERFQQMERAGRIEVTGMFANLTPLYDTDQLIETFQVLRTLRQDYGFTISHAMNCDVNGENWPLVDVLLDLGIEGFTMAINSHFGGPLRPRPYPFWWEGPSGRRILTYNGWPYNKGWHEGIGRDADDLEKVRWPLLQQYLDEIGYPLPIVLLQSYHPYGDNGSAFDFTPFIREWNAAGKKPHIVLATPRMWWSAVSEYADQLSTLRGDWTDYWNFGCISSAKEQAINRHSRARLRAADSLHAALSSFPVADRRWTEASFERYRDEAWWALHFWDEHTWGADVSIRAPESDDTAAQWQHKANYAYLARSLSLMLQRDALADFSRQVQRGDEQDLLVFNPLPWARTLTGEVPRFVLSPRGIASDTTAGRQHQDRDADSGWLIPPVEVPAFGYKVVARSQLIEQNQRTNETENAVVENHRYRIVFNRERGGIDSLFDKVLSWELVDRSAAYAFNGFVHEQVADTAHEWPRWKLFYQDYNSPLAEIPAGWKTGWHARYARPDRVVSHRVRQTPSGIVVEQTLAAPGIDGLLTQRVFLPDYADWLECSAAWNMRLSDHPEATYLLFPFDLPGAVARFDVGGQAVIPEQEQLPGVCRDYFTAQGWVDFSNEGRGVTIALPENPMVQLGDFHFGQYQTEFRLEGAMLLGWVTNNYWETNFRAYQPGGVRARYRILPHAGPFDEAQAHRFGLDALYSQPVFQHLHESPAADSAIPGQGAFLQLPQPPILTLHIKRAHDGSSLIVRLLNASDTAQSASLASGLLKIQEAARCDLLENDVQALPVSGGRTSIEIPARQMAAVRLHTTL
jgi:alpha-mannosidase